MHPPDSSDSRPANLRAGGDVELFRSIKGGQLAALGTLYDRFGGLVYGLALAILTNPQEAEDLTQEVFLSLFRNCTYDPTRGAPSSYLITLTRSRAIDRLRAKGRAAKLMQRWGQSRVVETSPVTPMESASINECSQVVRDALEKLSPNYRRVLEMSYFKELSQREIAEKLGTPLGTVKSWVRRGLSELKETLQEYVG
ncbi:MAG: sigma-70 family RNA polymerase sigma factor [Aphanocapsa lilacina HA4352-LM1]|jgi:RNA polymerase sigma-70 factor (ECF subfamily)|nr:sigma-70 family RNA polymerase sigma factor [Aphanocapsa lilacina HA4352-LM1]